MQKELRIIQTDALMTGCPLQKDIKWREIDIKGSENHIDIIQLMAVSLQFQLLRKQKARHQQVNLATSLSKQATITAACLFQQLKHENRLGIST